jgi:hypothetical protein
MWKDESSSKSRLSSREIKIINLCFKWHSTWVIFYWHCLTRNKTSTLILFVSFASFFIIIGFIDCDFLRTFNENSFICIPFPPHTYPTIEEFYKIENERDKRESLQWKFTFSIRLSTCELCRTILEMEERDSHY